jgi:quercetin dioxygenase-like cupin family protein
MQMSEVVSPKTTPLRWVLIGGIAILAGAFLAWKVQVEHRHVPTHSHAEAVGAEGRGTARPSTVVTPVSCEKLADIPGKSITTALVDFAPNAFTPRHRHPGSVTAFVLEGTLRSQLAGRSVGIYTKGQTSFEPPGAIHLFAENASATDPARLLAIFVADDDCGSLTIFD